MKVLLPFCLLFLLFGCSKNDDTIDSQSVPKDVIVISSNATAVFRTDISGPATNLTTLDLTSSLGIPADYSNFNASQGLLSFNKRGNNRFDFWEIDLSTEASFTAGDLCELEEFEGVVSASNTRDKLVQFTRQSIGVELNNYIHVYSKSTTSCTRTFLGVGGLSPFNAFYLGADYALVYLDAATLPFELSRVSLDTGLITHQITFMQEARVTVSNGVVHAFFVDDQYKTFSASTLEQLSESTFDFSVASVQTGVFSAQIKNGQMLIDLPYPQPSLFNTGPALINLENSQLVAGEDFFLFDLRIALEEQLQRTVNAFTTYSVDLDSGLIIVGYGLGDSSGGIVYTNFNAELIQVIPLDNLPKEIVIR